MLLDQFGNLDGQVYSKYPSISAKLLTHYSKFHRSLNIHRLFCLFEKLAQSKNHNKCLTAIRYFRKYIPSVLFDNWNKGSPHRILIFVSDIVYRPGATDLVSSLL